MKEKLLEEILKLRAKGLQAKEIGAKLGITSFQVYNAISKRNEELRIEKRKKQRESVDKRPLRDKGLFKTPLGVSKFICAEEEGYTVIRYGRRDQSYDHILERGITIRNRSIINKWRRDRLLDEL